MIRDHIAFAAACQALADSIGDGHGVEVVVFADGQRAAALMSATLEAAIGAPPLTVFSGDH